MDSPDSPDSPDLNSPPLGGPPPMGGPPPPPIGGPPLPPPNGGPPPPPPNGGPPPPNGGPLPDDSLNQESPDSMGSPMGSNMSNDSIPNMNSSSPDIMPTENMNSTSLPEEGQEGEVDVMTLQSDAIQRIPELELAGRGRKTALLVVNVQNCFFSGGAMAMFTSGKHTEDVENEKNLIRKINNLISLYEEDQDYFNAGLGGSPVMKGAIEVKTDPSTGMKYLDGSYYTGARKKYFFDHIIYTQTAYPPDHSSFASHHYLREKKQKLKDMMEMESISLKDAMEKLTDDQLDNYYWSFVNTNFENKGMTQFNKETNTKLWSDHALTDGNDVIIENKKCFRGIDFHPKLNLAPLYCPNPNINPQVYINPPTFDGRGKIIWLGGDDQSTPRSAFMNNLNESTGLLEYLNSKNIEELYIVGMFRDMMVELTAVDAVSNGFNVVNLIYDATLSLNVPSNNTKVNNNLYFRNIGEIIKYLELTGDDDEEKYYEFLRDNNIWVQNLEAKNVNVINYQNVIENIKVGKEEFTCGKDEDLIKTFDVFLKTSTSSSRNSKIM